MLMPFAGAARPLPLGALARAAAVLACQPAALSAVITVETGNRCGCLDDGRPAILYEAHIAYKLNGGRLVPGLAAPRWDCGLYADTRAGEWERLLRAATHPQIGRAVALQAASWGLGQVLGLNHRLAGFADVEAMVAAAAQGEEAQLGMMVTFIRARGLDRALRALEWSAFALGYNGTAFRQNAYDTKLAEAYRRALAGADDGVLAIGDESAEVASLQRALRGAGYGTVPDGRFGRMTALAVEKFQAARGLPATGRVDLRTARPLGLA